MAPVDLKHGSGESLNLKSNTQDFTLRCLLFRGMRSRDLCSCGAYCHKKEFVRERTRAF